MKKRYAPRKGLLLLGSSILIGIVSLSFAAFPIGTVQEDHYILENSTSEEKKQLRKLLDLLQDHSIGIESTFVILRQISQYFYSKKDVPTLNTLLTDYVHEHPQDPYNAYYLFQVARNYEQLDAPDFAKHYFFRGMSRYNDIDLEGESIHHLCLQKLIKLEENPYIRLGYYQHILREFKDEIDLGYTYYYLAKNYEELGDWDKAYDYYERFLKAPKTKIPSQPNVYVKVRNQVEFYHSKKDWTMESLEELITVIRRAIIRRNVKELLNYKAKVNFFAMSWEQEDTDVNSQIVFDIGAFLNKSKVGTSRTLDISSNAREAYLRTWGWSYRIRTWYLYFRKVYFPANPEINEQWEWAGIYFGEKL